MERKIQSSLKDVLLSIVWKYQGLGTLSPASASSFFFLLLLFLLLLLLFILSWFRAGEMVLFQRSQVQYPVPTVQLTTVCNSSPRGADVLFWNLWVLHACDVQIYIQPNFYKREIKINKISKNITICLRFHIKVNTNTIILNKHNEIWY